MVGELVKNPAHEPKAYAIMPFVWSIGAILGPAIGGMLANPVKSYPDFFSKTGIFASYPWLLPNLVCATLMLFSIIAGVLLLRETHPALRKGADPDLYHDIAEHTPMIAAAGANADPGVDLRQESYGTFNEVDLSKNDQWNLRTDGTSRPSSLSEKTSESWLTKKVVMLTVSLGLFTYHSMCYDHLLPIFFQDKPSDNISILATRPFDIPGGLGLGMQTVGLIMAVNGFIALFVQAIIFPLAAEWFGIWPLFVWTIVLHPVAYIIVPYLAVLPPDLLFPGIYFCLTVRNILSIILYPVLLILLKQASPSASCLGRINGLAASAGAVSRTVAPPVAGLLYGWGSNIGFTGLAWFGAATVAFAGVVQLWFVPRQRHETTVVKSMLPCLDTSAEQLPRDVVDITVVDTEDTA